MTEHPQSSERAGRDGRRRVLAIVARYLDRHTDYLLALAEHVDLIVVVSGEEAPGSVDEARREGLDIVDIGTIGLPRVAARLRRVIDAWRPHVVHAMWYTNEHLVTLARELVGSRARVVYECRDPLTALLPARSPNRGPHPANLERDALAASDAQIFVSHAVRAYLEDRHGLDLTATSMIVPQGLAARTMAEPSPKLSAGDGKVHLALVGTVSSVPGDDRHYLPLIRLLVDLGVEVHSHFHQRRPGANDAYRRLAAEISGYSYQPALSDRRGTELSRTLSRYDLLGAFYGEHAPATAPIYRLVMPAKTASAWVHGAIPLVCPRSFGGTAEWIEALGIGFLIDSYADLRQVVDDREAISAATRACLVARNTFTHEASALRIACFYERLFEPAATSFE
jgi:hypothetical protein